MHVSLEKVILLSLVLALVFIFPQVTVAQTILIDQQPNQVNTSWSDVDNPFSPPPQILAENFVLTTTETIGQIVIWGGYLPNNIPLVADNFTVIFHTDAAGLPGAVAALPEVNVPVTRVDTGIDLLGADEYRFTLTLASPVTLTPGTYWVEIYNDSTGSAEGFFWEFGNLDSVNGIAGFAVASQAPGAIWIFNGNSLAFQLITVADAVNVPSMNEWGKIVFILLAGIGSIYYLGRRTVEI